MKEYKVNVVTRPDPERIMTTLAELIVAQNGLVVMETKVVQK
jgi:hypothetical protein